MAGTESGEFMKEYCIIQSGSPADLSKVVQENLDQRWEPHGGLIHWSEFNQNHSVTDWFLQPIVRDKPTDSSRSVPHETAYTDSLIKALILSRPGIPGAQTELSDDLADRLLMFLKHVKRAIEEGDWK